MRGCGGWSWKRTREFPASGEFCALLDHDDLLSPDALYEAASFINQNPACDLIYSDHDLLSADGTRRFGPLFKPDWSPEIMLSANYMTHLTVIRTGILKETGGFDPQMDGAQDWDLFLRVSEKTSAIGHIPRILYHWRDLPGSTASDIWQKPLAPLAQLKAIRAHLVRKNLKQPRAFFDPSGFIRVRWQANLPRKVSIIIPTRGVSDFLRNCLSSIFRLTDYPNYEIILVNNGEISGQDLLFLSQMEKNHPIRRIDNFAPFNYSAANNLGAKAASGDLLLFLNNDTQILDPDWLSELAMWAEREEIGVVGAKLLYLEGTIQHAGVILGLTGFAGHIFSGQPENQWSIFGLAEWYRDVLAVTGACLMVRRDVFIKAGFFNEEFKLCGSDVAFCLRVHELGYRVMIDPFARIRHLESVSRRQTPIPFSDFQVSYRFYQPYIANPDPYFSPNLSFWENRPTLVKASETRPHDFVVDFLQKGGM
jgi:O-antigen biosynthesis protein